MQVRLLEIANAVPLIPNFSEPLSYRLYLPFSLQLKSLAIISKEMYFAILSNMVNFPFTFVVLRNEIIL